MRLPKAWLTWLVLSLLLPSGVQGEDAGETLSDRVLASQMMGIGLESLGSDAQTERWIVDTPVGLVIAYGASLRDSSAAAAEIARLRRSAPPGRTPLFAVDQEGGTVIRFAPAAVPSAMAIAAANDRDLAFRAAAHAGCELRNIGIDTVFAPALDLARPGSPLGTRAFAEDPERVSQLGLAVIRGFGSSGVLSIAKHFPGQGAAIADTHAVPAVIDLDEAELRRSDLEPFLAAVEGGVAGVMTAHAIYPRWAGSEGLPATFSRVLLEGFLRNDLGFDGLVVTDVLEMPGAAGRAGAGELAVRAIEAGADLVLVIAPSLRESVHDALAEAIRSGRLSRQRVSDSARRLSEARRKAAIPLSECQSDSGIAGRIARAAVTSVGEPVEVRPDTSVYAGPEGEIARAYRGRHFMLPFRLAPEQIETTARRMAAAVKSGDGSWVAGIHNRGHAEAIESAARLLDRQPDVLIVLGSPWDVGSLRPRRTIFTFGLGPASQEAALAVAMGKACATGRMPVSAPGIAAAGEWDEACEGRSRLSSGARGSR